VVGENRCSRIVVIDSDPAMLEYIDSIVADRFAVSLFTDDEQMLASLAGSPYPNLILMDWHIAGDRTGQRALRLLEKVLVACPATPVVIVSLSADLHDAVRATRAGASDILLKPFAPSDIELVVRQHISAENLIPCREAAEEIPLDENTSFVRCNKRMREIESRCILVARTDIPVLILGESGTGKEIAALFVHKMSARSTRPFLKVNCAAMPADLLESELFGYEQGAFTGAVKSKPGKFEICNNGTIFLDEIGEMPPALQAKMLQVLQDGSFSRLGSRSSVQVDVRVIAATNIDIKAAMAQKSFREDLYYRLNGISLHIPPLRERRDEIPLLTQYFMRRVAEKYGRDPLPISSALMQALASYSWPGNIRELENTVKRYLVLEDEQAIIAELESQRCQDSSAPGAEEAGDRKGLKRLVRNLKDDAESAAIAQTLENTGWNRKAAASDLQISYKALLYKIKQYNLSKPVEPARPPLPTEIFSAPSVREQRRGKSTRKPEGPLLWE
jgi:DNA-binding NtrC family response regulator